LIKNGKKRLKSAILGGVFLQAQHEYFNRFFTHQIIISYTCRARQLTFAKK